jgi:glutathione S-transferase
MIQLYTFTISHFAEKGRWALDRTGRAYEERVLVPGPHMRTLRRLGLAKTTVPTLVDDGKAIQGSGAIIDYIDERWLDAERRLTPGDTELGERSRDLERWLDAEVGEAARRVFYHHALPRRELVASLFGQRGPWWSKVFLKLAYPLIANRIRRKYAITAENVAADRERLMAAFRRLDDMLAKGPYLLGDRFGRADLTLAALTAPIWRPPEHPTRWPDVALLPEELQRWIDELGRFRIREHALRMYREHRSETS